LVAFLFLTRVAIEPKGTPVERNRISSSDYRKKNPEKAKTSARLSNFRARARKKGLTDEREIEEHVQKWEKEWQEKQAKEASEVSSNLNSVDESPSVWWRTSRELVDSQEVLRLFVSLTNIFQYFSGILLSAFE
jgi:hypothetical protein